MAGILVHDLHVAEEGRWQFRDSALTWQPEGRGYSSAFDPFPAYPHDLDHVRGAAADIAAGPCPPLWDVSVYVADREETSRSNAHADIHEGRYEDGEWVKRTSGVIVLSGKRTPPHPAMTRALVAHEYGHNVAYMLNSLRDGVKHLSATSDLERDYARARGLPESAVHFGEGGTWHDSACEILACDFRLLVLGVETEFWPHPGIERPEKIPALRQWWDAARAALGDARASAEGAAA
jgi:hypothetical protein